MFFSQKYSKRPGLEAAPSEVEKKVLSVRSPKTTSSASRRRLSTRCREPFFEEGGERTMADGGRELEALDEVEEDDDEVEDNEEVCLAKAVVLLFSSA